MTPVTEWIDSKAIQGIAGALKPSAYVARAYKYTRQNNGAFPEWTKKTDNEHWLFSLEYIKADAKINLTTIGTGEAAKILGAARRTVQTWVDTGEIPTAPGEQDDKNRRRRILRKEFMLALPQLKKRLQTPSVVGFKIKHGSHVPNAVIEQIKSERRDKQLTLTKEKKKGPLAGVRILLRTEAQRIAQLTEARLQRARKRKLDEIKKEQSARNAAAQSAEKKNKELKELKVRNAEIIEQQLQKAREVNLTKIEMEKQMMSTAEHLLEGILASETDRVNAAVTFNDMATRREIPSDIQVMVLRKYFGKS